MAKKKINNPVTGRAYQIRQRTTSKGKKGQIIGAYKQGTARRISSRYGSALRKLSDK